MSGQLLETNLPHGYPADVDERGDLPSDHTEKLGTFPLWSKNSVVTCKKCSSWS